jgi:hypothetical protein
MALIKTALEIALERTESVKGDKDSIREAEARRQGKKAANEFLADQNTSEQRPSEQKLSIEDSIKKTAKELRPHFQQGIFEVLVAQISLPATADDEKKLENIGKGLQAVIGDKRFSALYKQFRDIMSRYLDDSIQYNDAIKQQYEPTLRKKEEELSRRVGRPIKIDPFQDPEFVAFYNQNMNALKGNYQAAVDQVREQITAMFKK